MKYKAIIFDFNGVILWDRKWHEAAWNAISVKLRGKPFTKDEADKYIHGKPPHETFSYLLKNQSSKKSFPNLLLQKEKFYQKIALNNSRFRLSPGATQLFNLLKSAGVKQTIATSSPLMHVKFYYQHLNLKNWFPRTKIIYDNGTIPSKPAPDIYLKAAKKLNINIRECLVVEDALSGRLSAKNAKAGKIIALAQNDNFSSLEKLHYVSKVIKNLGQISLADFRQ